MKKYLIIGALCISSGMAAQTVSIDNTLTGCVSGMSPDGRYVVGYAGAYGTDIFKSFIYDTTTKQVEWKTSYESADYDKSGKFTAITGSGIIAGSMKDKDMMLEISGGDYYMPNRNAPSVADNDVTYLPLATAAVWRNGKTYKLGTGAYTLADFADESDGSYAVGISEDGNTVAGYIYSSWFEIMPIGWKYDSSKDAYDYFYYTLPNGAAIGTIKKISSDGTVAAGTTMTQGYTRATVWTSATEPQEIELGQESTANAISRNGKYVLVSGLEYSKATLSIYEVETGALQAISLPDKSVIATGLTIDDSGNATCLITDSDSWSNTLYYYSKQNNTIQKIDSYIELLGGGISSLNSSEAVSTSADGLIIAGKSTYSGSWVLTLPQIDVVTVNAPKGVNIFFNSTSGVTVKWNAVDEVPEDVTVSGYQVYLNNTLVETVDASEATDGKFTRSYDATLGTYSVYVKTVAKHNGNEITSSESLEATVSISKDTALYSFYNFDNASIDQEGNITFNQDTWTAMEPSNTETIIWSLDAADYENYTPFMATTATGNSNDQWNSILLSRFFDAKDTSSAFLTLYMKMNYVNTDRQDLSKDYLDIEYAFDGENWKTVQSFPAADLAIGRWNNFITKLPQEIYGKQFQLRLNAHGYAMVKWYVDNIGIIDALEADAPTGLRTLSAYNNGVELTWHNSIGSYEVSYVENSNVLTDYNAGNDGQPLLAAVEFEPEKMAPYVGQYISSVSSFIYDNPNIITSLPTKAEAIVYVDGEEATRQAFGSPFDRPYTSTVALSSPVKIEAGKTYRVAVRIYDYDTQQTPIYYQSAKTFIAGKTDLFSEDDGRTWDRLSDVYTGDDEKLGWCIWPIRANITAEIPTTTDDLVLDKDLLAYNVYRNGEQLNKSAIFAAAPHFLDAEPLPNADYAVQAFYTSGLVSPLSESLNVTPASVETISVENRVNVYPNPATEIIRLDGEFDDARLININGQKVAETTEGELNVSDLESGVYFVIIRTGNTAETHKVVVTK